MKQIIAAALIAAIAASGSVHAATSNFVVERDIDIDIGGYRLGELQGQFAFNYAELMAGFSDIAMAKGVAIAPGTFNEGNFDIFPVELPSVHAPLQRAGGYLDIDSGQASMKWVQAAGGFSLTTSALLPSGRKNAASFGGSLGLTSLTVDFESQRVYADVVGGNGVGTQQRVSMWNFGQIAGSLALDRVDCPLTPMSPCRPSLTPHGVTLSGIYLTQEGYDIMTTSLGLTNLGKASLMAVTDVGTMTISAVPEPASALLALSGMLAVALVGRKARHPAVV